MINKLLSFASSVKGNKVVGSEFIDPRVVPFPLLGGHLLRRTECEETGTSR